MPVQPIAAANEILARFGGGSGIDHMKLQKLLYFANGWCLGLTGQPLVVDRPQVWRYGPVFRWVYNAFSRYGNSPILQPAAGNPFGGEPARLTPEEYGQVGPFLQWIWGEYGGRTGAQLSDETHAPGTPWQRIAATNNYSVPLGTEIPARDDYEYFAQLARARGWDPQPFRG
jgi:uncharacterized phage-associated protein